MLEKNLPQNPGKNIEGIFSINQGDFQIVNSNCYFASALNGYQNNVMNRQMTLQEQLEFEREAYDKGLVSMTGIGNMVGAYKALQKMTGCKIDFFGFHTSRREIYLNKGYMISASIIVRDKRRYDWKMGNKIQGDYGKEGHNGHVIGGIRKEKDYMVNSRSGNNTREMDWSAINLYKDWNSCGVILP